MPCASKWEIARGVPVWSAQLPRAAERESQWFLPTVVVVANVGRGLLLEALPVAPRLPRSTATAQLRAVPTTVPGAANP